MTAKTLHKHCILTLGRAGDLANALPIAKHIHDTTGEPPLWIVHRLFLPILLGVSYVTPHPIVLEIDRVDIALQIAKEHAENVINATTWGKLYKGPRDKPYNFLSWSQTGFGKHFYDLDGWPLTFDRRDPDREQIVIDDHVKDARPVLLLNIGKAKSSPFKHHALFEDSIRRKWTKKFQIVDMRNVACSRIYDLLGLMERAAVMITADTATLHLATAVPSLKTICLTNDHPFLASEPRYKPLLKMTYSDAVSSLGSIHDALISI